MMHLHTGNRLEDLAQALTASEHREALHPLAPRILLTETPSLWRWLRNRFCHETGVAFLIETHLPAAWLWQQARHSLTLPPDEDPLSRERLAWRLFAQLGEHSIEPELATYLHDDKGLRRWQLAVRIADLFDRYQYYRPEWIRSWSEGGEKHWQARLWRRVSKNVELHRVALMDRFLERLSSDNVIDSPKRIDLFALHNLPPLLLDAFEALSRHTEVHLWLLSPTPEYWADLVTPKELARHRLESPENDRLWEAGNPLLTQWGRQGQAFQDLLLDRLQTPVSETEHYRKPKRDSLLHCIQADLFQALIPTSPRADLADERPLPSIQFHLCHGALREVQVLHDTLLHCLREDETLQPEDILVLVPEISRYAPAIEATFGKARGAPEIPWNLSDTTRTDEHPVIRAFLDLLDLPHARFTRADILGLADIPEVCRRYGLSEDDLAELAETLDSLRVYWGLDGEHKQRLDLPAIDEHTWHQGFQRIMAGFATGNEVLLQGPTSIAPLPGQTAQSAGRAARLFDLLDRLRHWAGELKRTASPQDWAQRLGQLLDDFFSGDDDHRLQRIRETLAELQHAEQAGVKDLPPQVIRNWLQGVLEEERRPGRAYTGGVTFCGMKPLRGVPFRVVCLLGMHDAAFPRRRRPIEFDAMQNDWRHGDPDPVHEDRYLFLEALMAARDRLIISYTGRDMRSNEPRTPSVLVQELLDYLDAHYSIGGKAPSQALARVHPLQPFSAGNFQQKAENLNGLPSLPGFNRRWLVTADSVRAAREHPTHTESGWPDTPLPLERNEPLADVITPLELERFFRDPLRQFIHKRLRITAPEEPELAEEEPLDLDNLQQWGIRELLIDCWLAGRLGSARDLARARGLLPHGPPGNRRFQAIKEDFMALRDRCERLGIEPPLSPLAIDIDLPLATRDNRWRLAGRITGVYDTHGLLQLSASRFSLDKLLPLWVRHLSLCADGRFQDSPAHFLCQNRRATLSPVDAGQAKNHLVQLLGCYEAGLHAPLQLPIKTAAAFVNSLREKPENAEAAHKAATKAWNTEAGRFFAQLILRNHDWEPGEDLDKVIPPIFDPLLEALEVHDE